VSKQDQPLVSTHDDLVARIATAYKSGTVADPGAFAGEVLAAYADLTTSPPIVTILDAARALYLCGKPVLAIPVAERAEKLALATQDNVSRCHALNLVGVCAADSGNAARATAAFSVSLDLANTLGDAELQSRAWQNIGVMLHYSGMFNEAAATYRKGLSVLENIEQLAGYRARTESMMRINIGLCHLLSGNPNAALREMLGRNDGYQPAEVAHDILNEVLSETYTVRAYVDLGQYEDAVKHAKRARDFANRTQSIRADINALVAEGLATTFSGNHEEGIALLQTAVARATESNVVSLQARQALVKALEFAQRNEEAVSELKAMMSAQRKTAETNALEHVKQHLATLHGGDIRQTTEEVVQVMRAIEGRIELLEGRVAKSELARQRQELFQARVETMERLAVAAELRDDATGQHAYRVGRMALLLAKEAGCDEDTVAMIDVAARLHDIGKVSVPDQILLKPGRLNPGERAVIEMHSEIGADILAKSAIPHIRLAEDIARHHHERWDGKGYPAKIGGMEIPFAARITALTDVYDALTHKRPYKQAWSEESALTEILAGRGTQFDPELTDLFLALVSRLRREQVNLDDYLGEAAKASPFIQGRSKIWDTLNLHAS
jgi:putative two-component system response regulator